MTLLKLIAFFLLNLSGLIRAVQRLYHAVA